MPETPTETSLRNHARLQELISADGDLESRLLQARQFLESVYRQLTEGSGLSFSGLFARTQYVHKQQDTPFELATQVNQLRLLCNKVAHEGLEPKQSDWLSALLTLRDLLRWLDPALPTPEADSFLSANGAEPFPAFKAVPRESFACVVQKWRVLKQGDRETGLELQASDETGNDLSIKLNDRENEGCRWSALNKALWRYAVLNCFNLTPVTGQERCFSSSSMTVVVVEPDFLLDATAVAECFDFQGVHPEYFVIERLYREASSEKPVQGNMVNFILDELVSQPEQDYKSLFRKAMAGMPISLVALGKEVALQIHESIGRIHYPSVKAYAESLKNEDVQLEPTYISPEYGLQGRLDILHSQAGKQNIAELKSGSTPNNDVWPQQKMQVVAYNLIVRNAIPRAKLGNSSIFYSAGGDSCLRHVVTQFKDELSLLMCRNRIVGILHGLAEDPAVFFNWLLGQEQPPNPKDFKQNHLQEIVTTLKGLQDYEYEWFLGQTRLLAREIWFEKTGGLGRETIYGHNALWRESLAGKRDRYRILSHLKIAGISFNRITFTLPSNPQVTDFRAGDIVVLYRQKQGISQQEILRGTIERIGDKEVEVRIRGGLKRVPQQYHNEIWAIEHDILDSALYTPLSSIYSFLKAPPETRQLFLGLREPESADISSEKASETQRVMERMLASRDYHIVQGPPGTGKTSGLLTAYILRLFKETGKNVLILSFTNRAVDEICLNLRKHSIPFIRTGHSDEIVEELLDNRIKELKFDPIDQVIRSCRVWVATINSCSSWILDIQKLVKFDELVIDEASQIVENSILGIIAKLPKTILIGDQNQLPPITRQGGESFGYVHPQLAGLCYDSYGQSLMERLYRVCQSKGWNGSITMLREHWRMHEDIANLVQPYYQGNLTSMRPGQREPLNPGKHPLLASRLVWIECPPSRFANYDPLQVRVILRILALLTEEGAVADPVNELGIVAPFRAMIHALLKELPPAWQRITIDTVERFQGSERANIILTLPLHTSSSLRNIEALSSDQAVDRKLNVAVSRARERIWVLGCGELCQGSAHYRALLENIGAAGTVINYQEILIQE